MIKFQFGKKEATDNGKKPEVEKETEVDFSSIEERNAIEILNRDRYYFILELKKHNSGFGGSDAYKTAYNLLVKSSRVDIANMINRASEAEIKKRGAYFIAAFNILCDIF